jgi:glutathione S-transferase
MGKVPALTDRGALITETPAICLYLADRYSYGALAPTIEDPLRGPYCRWLIYSTAVLEPGVHMKDWDDPEKGRGVGWGAYDTMLDVIEQALTPGPYLLGERFTAADVAFGAVFAVAMFNKRLPARPTFAAYNDRLAARPACKRAMDENWPAAELAKLQQQPSQQ